MLMMRATATRVTLLTMSRGRATRVAIDVTPRLLEDAVSRVLTDHGLDVVALPADSGPADIVVTTAGAPVGDSPAMVAVYPAAESPPATSTPDEPVLVHTLGQLMAAIRNFTGTLSIVG
jgi:hypothetical protein